MARSDWRRPELEPLREGFRRFRMTVAYNGGHYSGWQKQENADTVQQQIENALERMGFSAEVEGSGRTDSGVHAMGQVCHFDISNQRIQPNAFVCALNKYLPKDIRILDCDETDGSFHARFTSMSRMYRYFIKRESDMTPFDDGFYHHERRFPDIGLLNSYAGALVGTHDFTTFTASGDLCPSKYRDIYESYWEMGHDRWGYDILEYTICGNAFLYRMVRSLVGTMLEFAKKNRPAEDFISALESKERKNAGKTAPGCGLYLYSISYDEEKYAWFEEKYAHD